MGTAYLGEFEELVLLAICGLPSEAYAVAILERLEEKAGRAATIGSVYRALTRLEQKGFVSSHMGAVTRRRGGKAKRLYEVTGAGRAAVLAARSARERLWEDLDLNAALRMT